ncbi:MAG: hypothetical protein HC848_09605, partial [Limnobacter sp.]|nr:hypothetical protein [Limnobacter sp.]
RGENGNHSATPQELAEFDDLQARRGAILAEIQSLKQKPSGTGSASMKASVHLELSQKAVSVGGGTQNDTDTSEDAILSLLKNAEEALNGHLSRRIEAKQAQLSPELAKEHPLRIELRKLGKLSAHVGNKVLALKKAFGMYQLSIRQRSSAEHQKGALARPGHSQRLANLQLTKNLLVKALQDLNAE